MRVLPLLVFCVLSGLATAQSDAADAYNFAAGLHDRGLFDRAIPAFQSFLERWPRDARAPKARFYLGQCHAETGADAKAARCFEDCLKTPGHELLGRARLRAAEIRLRLGEAENAQRHARTLLQHRPAPELEAPGRYYLAEACAALGQTKAAREAYQQLLKRQPKHRLVAYAHAALAFLDFQDEDFETARDHFTAARARAGEDADLRQEAAVMIGECALSARLPEPAHRAFRDALKEGAGRFEMQARMGLAQALLDLKQAKAALQAFRDLARRYPDDPRLPRALIRGAAGLHELNRSQDGLALLGLVRDAEGQDAADLAYWSGRLLEAGGNTEAALEQMRSAATTPERRFSYGDALARAGKHREAAALFAALARETKDEKLKRESLFAEAFSRNRLGQHERAVELLRPLVDGGRDPEFERDLRFALAENLFQLGRFQEAAGLYDGIARSRRGRYRMESRHKLAWCHYRRKDHARALGAFRTLLKDELPPALAEEVRYLMARCHEALGQHERAASLFEAVASGRGSMATQALLGRAASLRRDKKSDEAIPILREAVRSAKDDGLRRDAAIALGDTLLETRRFEDAARIFAQLKTLPKAPAVIGLKLAWALEGQGEHEAAAREALAVARADQSAEVGGDALYLAGVAHHARDEHGPAAAALAQLLQSFPSHPRRPSAEALLGISLSRIDRQRDAIPHLRAAAARKPHVADRDLVLYELAFCLEKSESEKERDQIFAALLREEGKSRLAADVAFRLGEAAYKKESFESARRHYERCFAHPEAGELAAKARYKAGWCERKLKRPAAAAAHFQAVAKSESPLAAESCYLAAEDLEAAERWTDALSFWERMNSRHRDHELAADAACRRVLCLARLGRKDAVIKQAPAVLQRHPKAKRGTAVRSALGDACFDRERWERARTAYRSVLEASDGPLAARAQFRIGRSYEREQKAQQAIDEYLRVTILYAHAEWVAKACRHAALLLEAQGEKAKARRLWEELARDHRDRPEGKEAARRLAERNDKR